VSAQLCLSLQLNSTVVIYWIDFAGAPPTIAEDRTPATTPSRAIPIAPPTHPILREFCRAVKEGQDIARLRYLLDQGANIDSGDEVDRTALFQATLNGDHEVVQFLLQHGADVNSRHGVLGKPLCIAALKGYEKVVEILLKHRASVQRSDGGDLGSVMHCACFGGNVAIFKSILEKGGDLKLVSGVSIAALYELTANNRLLQKPRKQDDRSYRFVRCSPLLLAAERCNFNILRLCWIPGSIKLHEQSILSKKNCSPSEGCWGPCWDLGQAHKLGHQTTQTYSTRQHNKGQSAFGSTQYTSSDALTSSGWSFMGFPRPSPLTGIPSATLLMWAAASLNLDLIDHLLESGASVDQRDVSGKTALHYAASPFEDAHFGAVDKCVARLSERAPSSMANASNLSLLYRYAPENTPLSLTINKEHAALDPRVSRTWGSDVHARCVAALLDNIESVPERRVARHEGLFRALSQGIFCLETIEQLSSNDAALCDGVPQTAATTETGLRAEGRCQHSRSALHEALEYRAPLPIIQSLLQHRLDPNGLDHGHVLCTPLLVAIRQNADIAVISLLVSHGADPDMKNEAGETPRLLAKQLRRHESEMMFNKFAQRTGSAVSEVSSTRWFHNLSVLWFRNSR
jgi:ankyrin repeat protein